MQSRTEWLDVSVSNSQQISENVCEVTFSTSRNLTNPAPGAHIKIEVQTPHGPAIRHYTVVNATRHSLTIAVRRHEHSRGGSDFVWGLSAGDKVRLTMPESHFPLSWTGSDYLLIAGGIGITPIIGMARALFAHGREFRLLYAGKSEAEMAYLTELRDAYGDRVQVFESAKGQRIDLAAEFSRLGDGAQTYICGPLRMLEDARKCWAESKKPVSGLRFEVFGDSGEFAETPFTVRIEEKDMLVTVPPNQSLLDALIEAGVDMIHDCKRGECGLCAVYVKSHTGNIDHRDVFFSNHEKQSGEKMCTCVSRISNGDAVIDVGYRAS